MRRIHFRFVLMTWGALHLSSLEMLMLPSSAPCYLRAPDGDTNNEPCECVSLEGAFFRRATKKRKVGPGLDPRSLPFPIVRTMCKSRGRTGISGLRRSSLWWKRWWEKKAIWSCELSAPTGVKPQHTSMPMHAMHNFVVPCIILLQELIPFHLGQK